MDVWGKMSIFLAWFRQETHYVFNKKYTKWDKKKKNKSRFMKWPKKTSPNIKILTSMTWHSLAVAISVQNRSCRRRNRWLSLINYISGNQGIFSTSAATSWQQVIIIRQLTVLFFFFSQKKTRSDMKGRLSLLATGKKRSPRTKWMSIVYNCTH